jgi:hypothetical protein
MNVNKKVTAVIVKFTVSSVGLVSVPGVRDVREWHVKGREAGA